MGARPESPLPAGTKWTYVYRAVDSTGATIDFLLSANRDAAAAKRFFKKHCVRPAIPDRGLSMSMGIRPIRRSLQE
jgi:hypothetical protein